MKEILNKNYRILNLILSIFTYTIVIAVVFLNMSKNIFWGIIVPLILSLLIIILVSLISDFLIEKSIERKKIKKLKAKEEEMRKANYKESYNMYPINPRFFETGLTDYQYEKLKYFRICNILVFMIIELIIVILFINFKSNYIFHDIILPILMISGTMGIIGTIIDFIIEAIIKRTYIKRKKNVKTVKVRKKNFLTKNFRIYYVPIVLVCWVIEHIVVYEYKKFVKSMLIPGIIIAIVNIAGIIILDLIFSKLTKLKKTLISELTTPVEINYIEERDDSNEVWWQIN